MGRRMENQRIEEKSHRLWPYIEHFTNESDLCFRGNLHIGFI